MTQIRLLGDMHGREGQKTALLLDGHLIKRRVYYRKHEGLFVLIRNHKIFDYDFYTDRTIEVDFI